MRCPACGATNPETAAWCGQCYRRFDEEVAPRSPNGSAAAPGAPAAPAPPPQTQPGSNGPSEGTVTSEGFRRSGDEIEWECPGCGTFNSIDLQSCAVCGTSFLERFRSEEPEVAHNWSTALLLSAVAPGAGHISVGRYGTGSARLLLFVAWVVGAVLLATSAGSGGLIAATPLLLGAVVLWVLTLIDVYRLQQGESELLVGRTFLWLVVGVLLLLGIALFASVGTATAPVQAATP